MRAWFNGSGSSLFPLLLLLGFPLSATAEDAPQQIRAALDDALSQEVVQWQQQHPGHWLKSKIRIQLPSGAATLPPCTQPLQLEGERGRFPVGRQHRRVSCPSPKWSLRVRSTVSLEARVPVTRAKLMAGHLIQPSQLHWQQRALTPSDGDLLMSIASIAGQRARRGIRAGSPIKAQQLMPPLMVERGQQVVMVARGDSFAATTSGIALKGGSEGEVIKVKNSRSGKIVSARIVATGKVETIF
ncbi:flagellar basal body P-ring formation chaperone FlgA [Ferrimonas sp. YFM]|uniref:flagellar basal body P-ring formation chaperone FlgA n=1 Tax=Ferrimonas sp. YFM TaxID=3028878 RepID=UPI0025734332|nr:flagellar basal body P-ring formation chaperone FlgA [Ferrimonas sp. YFM]BDY05682.1 flagella basal body P-ring formation protein FlgA [Ferrimonas sp. YFM]